jgi:tetratricopeptide (TPR) repeat protein
MKAGSAPFNTGQALNQALALHRQGQLRDAEKIYARVLKAAPDNFDALNLLGAIKARQGQFGEAQRLFAAAVKANPQAAPAWSNLGQAQYALKRPADALQSLDRARALAPDDADILYQHANVLLSLNRPGEALAELQNVLARKPQHVEAHLNSGIAHAALGFPVDALAQFDAALALVPAHPVAHYNRGVALIKLGRYEEAVAANERAIAAAPQHIGALLNRGKALAQLKRFDAAIASYGEVLALRKDHADAHFNAALARLATGDYQAGFAEYEWRWRRTGMPPQQSRGRPLWRGEYPLGGRTILLHAEQGLGDTIQFARYVPLLAAQGANIVLEVQPELKTLLGSLDGAGTVVARGEALPSFDVHCPLGSLPLALKTGLATVPAANPYLTADAALVAAWSARIEALPRPRIALAWSGNSAHDNDRNRSLAFATLAPLLTSSLAPTQLSLAGGGGEGEGLALEGRVAASERGKQGRPSFISIQRDLRDADAVQLAAAPRVTHFGDALSDFADTAAVLALCDLVISVDTAPAHLAGAVGTLLWVLVPFAPDWRWTLDGAATPWYPAARLFRQSAPGDWSGAIDDVFAALREMLSGR